MPLISRIPEVLKELDWTAKDLERAVVRSGVTFGWNTAWSVSHGNLPSIKTLEKICDTLMKQPGELVMWEE